MIFSCLRANHPRRVNRITDYWAAASHLREHSRDAVTREFTEELGVEFAEPTLVGTFERVFTYDGKTAHELWRVYEGHIVQDWPYDRESFTFVEPELDTKLLACWMPVERLRDDETTFYAPAVLDALDE